MRLERFQRFVAELGAAAERPPGMLVAMVHAEGRARRIGQRRLLADVEIERRLRHLDGRRAHGIERLQAGHDLARRKGLDLKLVVGGVSDVFRKSLRRAEDGIERFWKARGQAPLDLGRPCAIAGAATSAVAPARAPPLRNVRRFMMCSLPWIQVHWRGGKEPSGTI